MMPHRINPRSRRLLGSAARMMKPVLSRTLLRPGTVRMIRFGPSRGLRYRIFPKYGLAPLIGGWEPEAQALMAQIIKAGSVAYDIGANHGIHTMLMARCAGPNGRVFSFEPLPELVKALGANASLNGFTNVSAVGMAVSDHVGSEAFVRGHHEAAGYLAASPREPLPVGTAVVSEDVGSTTLDAFVYEDGNPAPGFIKIDVEGAEGRVLKGADRVLAEHRPVLLIDLHNPEQDASIANVLRAHGYTARRTDDPGETELDLRRTWPEPTGVWGQVIAWAK
jgi:FkbM family methyltransferase